VREQDLRATLELVGEAHHAETLDDFRSVLLPALHRLIPADFASYNEIPHDGGSTITVVVPDDLPAWAYAVWERHALENPIVQYYNRTRDGRAYRFSALVPLEQLRRRSLYREFYAHFSLDYQVAVGLASPPRLTIGIALSRSGSDFSQRDRDVLDLARPHLIQAYRNVTLRERYRRVIAGVRAGLDDGGHAMVVLDRDGNVAFLTDAARGAIASVSGEPLEEGAPLPGQLSAIVHDGGVGVLSGDHRALLVRRVPARGDTPEVVVLEPGARVASRALLVALGLTGREADVLQGLMRGRATAEIAAALGISPRTVHKHTERIFAKLGVHDRVEAVAVAWASIDDPAA